ncbi:MAG: FtsX-like permease family protein [Lachnospiraceae bacterium]|nr:FtsX-like permease family protein [Lachnospiraceae bacterium]
MLQKMWHKKWMNLSLLLGCILLVATAVSFPLYQSAVYDRMLLDEFDQYYSQTGVWPTQINMNVLSKKDKTGKNMASIEKLLGEIYTNMGVREKSSICFYSLEKAGVHSELLRLDAEDISVKLAMKTELDSHIDMVNGEIYSEAGLTEDGAIEVVISQSCLVTQGFIVGETMQYDAVKDFNGNPLRFCVKGVFEKNDDDLFWQEEAGELDNVCFMNPDLFREMFTGERAGRYNISCRYLAAFEYEDLTAEKIPNLLDWTSYYVDRSPYKNVIKQPIYTEAIDSYNNKIARISATLVILQVPVFIMLATFLLMISGQMYEMERNEISVIKSRGSSRAQIFRLYLYQALVLTISGAALGIPLGMMLSRLLGATRNFLIFDLNERLDVRFTQTAAIYAGAAMLLGLLCLTIPAIRHSKVSIVNLKQQKALKKKALWEKLFIDLVCIAVAGYGYYNFRKSSADMAESVLNGKALDPLLYLASSLMIIGLGLLMLRLQPYLLRLIYTLGKKAWKPASFVSFMENVKNGRKQQLIMLFLMMTVSLGMYHSTVARTIVENAVINKDYIDGADLIMKELWYEGVDSQTGARTGRYIEPDMGKYISAPFISQYTKVYNYDDVYAGGGKNGKFAVRLLGVHTKEYGEITYVDKQLNGKHYYELLNELAVSEDGLLVSSNFRDKLGFKVGDTLTFQKSEGKNVSGVIIDFFDYWPGYAKDQLVVQPDGSVSSESSYLVVSHFEYLRENLGEYPYEIWASTRENATTSDIYAWLNENKVSLKKYTNRRTDIEAAETDPLLQGTNGILTLGFVITIILCGIGYLIYWIMALRERELVFGVLRASGFHKGELFHMLINEQVFCGIFSIAAGLGIGYLTSTMFVPILQKAYASTEQVLPLKLITETNDYVRLISVIAVMMIICLIVLTVMLLRMNVTKALKLGED